PKNVGDEIYILGNPPYKGFSQQDKMQKEDIFFILGNTSKLDYISCWFFKGADYIKNADAKLAFVSTNSISQGEQVDLIWSKILQDNIEIFFAYPSFKWQNNAKDNAGVTVIIVGLQNVSNTKNKKIYTHNFSITVDYINPYLSSAKISVVSKRGKPLSNLSPMVLGNMPNDWGYLHFNDDEKKQLISEYPIAEKYFKRVIGSQEFINGNIRWCLWISDNEKDYALSIPPINERVKLVEKERAASKKSSYNKFSSKSYKFIEIRHKNSTSLIVPGTSSERRKYIPIGFLDKQTIINNLAFAIYDAEPWLFGVLTSSMHNLWVKSVGGSLETRIRYSSVLCYNTFPFPNISQKQKDEITELVFAILDEREKHSQKTLAQLYDPDKMPEGLKKAHHNLDIAIEQCYRSKPFESDEERLEYLFKMYEEMTKQENK
ncbi:MAG: hypothetical protein RBS32_08060, partial [Aliarcobacter sp.]|nr:hypothetical protein [Aliarcobacter sp.]